MGFVVRLWAGSIKCKIIYNRRCGTKRQKVSAGRFNDTPPPLPPGPPFLGNSSSFPHSFHYLLRQFSAFLINSVFVCDIRTIVVLVALSFFTRLKQLSQQYIALSPPSGM